MSTEGSYLALIKKIDARGHELYDNIKLCKQKSFAFITQMQSDFREKFETNVKN